MRHSTTNHPKTSPGERPDTQVYGRIPFSRRTQRGVRLGPAFLLLLVLALAACTAGPVAAPRTVPAADAAKTVFVVSNGWHSNIVIARADLPAGLIPEIADFPEAGFLEFGWGDAEYYPAKRTTIWITLRAALLPSPAVLHLVGADRPPDRRYPEAEVLALPLDDDGLTRLVGFIDDSFERGDGGRAEATAPGLYPNSRFYPATGQFHLGNTCNTWTAKALAEAGLAVTADGTSTAEDLMRQLRRLARQP